MKSKTYLIAIFMQIIKSSWRWPTVMTLHQEWKALQTQKKTLHQSINPILIQPMSYNDPLLQLTA